MVLHDWLRIKPIMVCVFACDWLPVFIVYDAFSYSTVDFKAQPLDLKTLRNLRTVTINSTNNKSKGITTF